MTLPHSATPAELNDALWRGDATSAAAAAEQLGTTPPGALTGGAVDDWLVTVYDKMWHPVGIIGDYIEHSGLDPRNGVPAATLKLKGDDPHIPMFLNCQKTMVGVTIETEGLRWAFYVDTFDYEFKPEGDDGIGVWTGTANLVGIWDVLNFLQIWPDFWAPIQAQIFSHAVVFGPMVSSIQILVMEQALRIQLGLWEFVNNALSFDPDIAAWVGTLLEYGGNIFEMLQAPIVVALENPLADPSMLVIRTIRMESCGAVIKEMTKSTGIDVRVDLWLPGDAQPDNVWIELKLPSYVVRVTDRSQITGPTHSILDSVIKTLVDLVGSVMGDILAPLILGADEVPGLPQGFWIAPALGVNYLPPWVLLVAPEPGQPGSVETCRITAHTPKGWQQIIGGRSPQWVGAPLGKLRGAPAPGADLTQRFDKSVFRMADRRHIHFHRICGNTQRPDVGVPQQRVSSISAMGIVFAPPRGRHLPPGYRSVPRHRLGPLQFGNHFPVHQRVLG